VNNSSLLILHQIRTTVKGKEHPLVVSFILQTFEIKTVPICRRNMVLWILPSLLCWLDCTYLYFITEHEMCHCLLCNLEFGLSLYTEAKSI